MGIYLLLFIIVAVFLLIEMSFDYIRIGAKCIKVRSAAFWIIFFAILLLGTLKGETYGYDADSYKMYYFDYFRQVSLKGVFSTRIEPGFAFVSFIICKITTHFWIYRAILFLITFGGLSKIIWDKSLYVSLSYLLYLSLGFVSFDMFILRQALAVTIIFLGYDYLEKRKYLKFSMFILAAASFHYTALIVFALLPLTSKSFVGMSMFKRTVYIGGSIIVGSFFLPRLTSMDLKTDYSASIVSGTGYGLLLFLGIYFFILSLFKRKYTDIRIGQSNNAIYEYCLGSLYIQIIALFFSLFNRTIYYTLIYSLINIPRIVTAMNIKSRKTFIAFTFVLMALMYYMTILNAAELIPYKSIFQ